MPYTDSEGRCTCGCAPIADEVQKLRVLKALMEREEKELRSKLDLCYAAAKAKKEWHDRRDDERGKRNHHTGS